MSIKRRDFLLGAASVALGGPEMPPLPLPYGPTGFDPRQPLKERILPPAYKTRPYTMQPSASPVHLSGSLVLRANTSGSVPPAALKNPMGQAMELLEVKFELSGVSDGTNAAWGGTIQCELMLGTIKITNGSIPVWNFGRAENLDGETKLDTNDGLSFQSYSWRLPRPLFIPAGAVCVPKFTHSGLVSSTVNVRVGYSCRTVFAQPKVVYVPWIAKYISKVFNPITSAGVDVSSELDMVNATGEVIQLQRLVGRALIIGQGGDGVSPSESYCPSFSSQSMLVRITDSYGRPVVGSFTPFRSVFEATTRSWDLDNGAELDPESWYRVELKKAVTTTNNVTSGQLFVSMIGWRELPGPSAINSALTAQGVG